MAPGTPGRSRRGGRRRAGGEAPKAATILLVEDDVSVREMYELKLSLDGYHVVTADDGGAGLDRAREITPDLVLLDIRMPVKDGFEVLQELRADSTTSGIPVVILTNYGEPEMIKRSRSLGATEFLVKAEATPGMVSERIAGWLRRD